LRKENISNILNWISLYFQEYQNLSIYGVIRGVDDALEINGRMLEATTILND